MFINSLSYFKVKGLLLAIIYLTLSVFFVVFVPKTVPEKPDLKTIRLSEDSLDLAYDKKANTSYFTGTYENAELRTVKLTFEEGLKLYGTNEFFIQMKEPPEFYDLMIHKDKTLFNERYTIYQLEDEKDVLISYDHSAQIEQKQKNKFFFFGMAVLAFFGFVLIYSLIVKIKNHKPKINCC